MLEWKKITKDEWEQFPTKAPTAPDRWAPILDILESGEIVSLPYSDDKQLRGMRVALGRRAKQRGLTLEVRTHDHTLAARKVASTGRPVAPDTMPAPRGRRGRRSATQSAASASEDA